MAKNMKVVKMTLKELSRKLYRFYNDIELMNEIIRLAMTDYGYNNNSGLVIVYSESEEIFVVLNSNPMYNPIMEPLEIVDDTSSLNKEDLEKYEFCNNSKFNEDELRIIDMALKMKEQNEPVSKLLVKCLIEMLNIK